MDAGSLANGKGKKAQKGANLLPLSKQKSVGFDIDASTNDVNIDSRIDPDKLFVKSNDSYKGVRKSDNSKQPTKDNGAKVQKSSNFSFKSSVSKSGKSSAIRGRFKDSKQMNRDDFLKATMRIFLVVSPPVGKMQV